MIIVKASEDSTAAMLEDRAQVATLLEFHDAMVTTGVVVSVEAVQPAAFQLLPAH